MGSVLNAYDRSVFSAVAQVFRPKFLALDAGIRGKWLQSFQYFRHDVEKDFLQMLEVAPMIPSHPGYKKLRCRHHAEGSCALGESCTFSHDPQALPTLPLGESFQRPSSVMLTQCQLMQGRGAYTNTPSFY